MISHIENLCLLCGGCVGACPKNAITLHSSLEIDEELCDECSICVIFCPVDAIRGG